MFGSTNLEIAIGIIVVFIIVSTICAAIREGLESILKTRAAYLEQGIRQLLHDDTGEGVAARLYNHPLVFGLFNGNYKAANTGGSVGMFARGQNLPSYIPSKNFARALMDIAAAGTNYEDMSGKPNPEISLRNIRDNVANIGNPAVQRVLLNAVDMAQGDLNKAQANLENWFNSGMDRVSGWYKRSTQYIIFGIALIVAVGMNINTITIVNQLAENENARKMMVAQAEILNKNNTIAYEEAKETLEGSNLLVGWPIEQVFSWKLFFECLIGWLITAFAATLGAPYWFDLLNKCMVIRSTVKPHEKSLEEASQDAQPNTPKVVYISNTVPGTDTSGTGQHEHNDIDEPDGCDVAFTDITADEDLPEAKGGVAP